MLGFRVQCMIKKILACFWMIYAVGSLVAFAIAAEWRFSTVTLPQWGLFFLLVCLFVSGLFTLRDHAWGVRIQVPLMLLMVPPMLILSVFRVWRGSYGPLFWISA